MDADKHFHSFTSYICVYVRYKMYVCVCVCSVMSDCATPWTIVHWAPLSMELCRQKYWKGLPLPTPGDLPDPGIKPMLLESLALTGRFFTIEPPGSPEIHNRKYIFFIIFHI